ncbi:hypothetical protein EJ06DRAFT_333998 [Trichodelitschia bisporula]|uniref:Uncharacterized protein n=1 Tax=Trichodelitschia bisporula TaxID=703511 RepID=A0A6G1I2C4_9PEZI|nr:hypothetical protein EJ06DRAFT_333998 [Trichodelitschia bisporula]
MPAVRRHASPLPSPLRLPCFRKRPRFKACRLDHPCIARIQAGVLFGCHAICVAVPSSRTVSRDIMYYLRRGQYLQAFLSSTGTYRAMISYLAN